MLGFRPPGRFGLFFNVHIRTATLLIQQASLPPRILRRRVGLGQTFCQRWWKAARPIFKSARGACGTPERQSHLLHVALYTPDMEKRSLSEYTFQVTTKKGNQKNGGTKQTNLKNQIERMHCVARVSMKFKAIFRAHRFLLIVIDHRWWTQTRK